MLPNLTEDPFSSYYGVVKCDFRMYVFSEASNVIHKELNSELRHGIVAAKTSSV